MSRRPGEARWSLESLWKSVHKKGVGRGRRGRGRRGGGRGNTQRPLLLPCHVLSLFYLEFMPPPAGRASVTMILTPTCSSSRRS